MQVWGDHKLAFPTGVFEYSCEAGIFVCPPYILHPFLQKRSLFRPLFLFCYSHYNIFCVWLLPSLAMSQAEISPPKNQQDEHVECIEAEQSTKSAPAPASNDAPDVKKDDALQLIEDMGYSTILTPENNKQVLRKIDLRLLPILLAIYFLQQLDKSTLSYASVFGLIEKANLHGQMYSWLGSVVYLAQLIFQPLVSYLLVKVPLGKFLAASCLLWGIALSCMAAADTFASLLVCRLFLGIFEAGIGEIDRFSPNTKSFFRLTSE